MFKFDFLKLKSLFTYKLLSSNQIRRNQSALIKIDWLTCVNYFVFKLRLLNSDNTNIDTIKKEDEISINSICGEESLVNDLAVDLFLPPEETNQLQDH